MSTVRPLHSLTAAPPDTDRRDTALAVLGEIVAQLAERVELVEIREGIARACVSTGLGRLGTSS